MIITGITELSRTRSRIEIDHQFAFVLYKGELRHYHLQEGEEIKEADYNTIMQEVLPRRAKLRCMNLLKNREYTTQQLHAKLAQGGYPESAIEEALSYVASFHYTDDLRYATDYITSHESTRSRRRIEQDLYSKGIPQDIVEQAWAEWQALGGEQDESAMICTLLTKRGYNPDTADFKEKQRVFAYLMRKGYSSESIRHAMAGFSGDYDD